MNISEEKKTCIYVVCTILLIAYFICPPYDKFAQIGYIFNNISFMKAKITNDYANTEYLFHRNNAIYLAKMNNKRASLKEIDKSIGTYPSTLGDSALFSLYSDRAKIRMYYKDYKGALDDLLRIPNPNINDNLKIAMLLKEQGNNKMSVSYCNRIIDLDIKAYAGYACIADVYAGIGKYDASVMIYDLLIDRVPGKARYYADRAMYKKSAGDIKGYEEDMQKAKDIYPLIDEKESITYDAIHPKYLDLAIM